MWLARRMVVLSIAWTLACGAPEPDQTNSGTGGETDALGDSSVEDTTVDPEHGPPKILLIVADDFGVDSSLAYADTNGDGQADDGRSYAATPTIHRLCHEGRQFTQAWSQSICSPTRASLLTGRYAFRTGVGAFTVDEANTISSDEITLPKLLDRHSPVRMRHANIGKWHLGATSALGGASAPNTMGWQHFSGLLEGVLPSYFEWPKTQDGETHTRKRYATTDTVDDALAWLSNIEDDEGWLLWLAFAAPHTPYHLPPNELHSHDELTGEASDILEHPLPYFQAMVEAMDTEIARLLDALEYHDQTNLHVIFVGDNGTDSTVVRAPFEPRYAKPTLFEGGLRVPLCIYSPEVKRPGKTEALVHVVDLLPTMLELAGVVPDTLAQLDIDGQSLKPHLHDPDAASGHDYVLSEVFNAFDIVGEGRAIRDKTRKLIVFQDGRKLYFDLENPLWIEQDLLLDGPLSDDEFAHFQRLEMALEELQGQPY